MKKLLVTIFFFAQPMLFIQYNIKFGGLNFIELFASIFSGVLLIVPLTVFFRQRVHNISTTDFFIILFILWCTCVVFIHFESLDLEVFIKLILPPLTFLILKRAIATKQEYLKLIKWLILGFTVPVLWSAILTLQGKGLDMEMYYTGIKRYKGVYAVIHAMGHNMGFLLMVIAIYICLVKNQLNFTKIKLTRGIKLFFGLLATAASYCLYNSQVRTVYIGLLVFIVVSLFYYSKKALILFIVTAPLIIFGLSPFISKIFFDVIASYKGERDIDRAGSGRPIIWKHNLSEYSHSDIDQQLTGFGFKERGGIDILKNKNTDDVWNSHNDFIELLMRVGAVGLFIYCCVLLSIFLTIIRMHSKEKYSFLAFFLAVMVMNFLSNSYVSRVGLGQMFYIVLIYIELVENKLTANLANLEKHFCYD